MPYNNTPITPSREVTGTVALPCKPFPDVTLAFVSVAKTIYSVARVKKIIAQDEEISQCSANAAFVITLATEMFLQHLVDQSYNIVKTERKPRRNIQYRDVGEWRIV